MSDDLVCRDHPGAEWYCTCSDVGDERFLFEFQLRCYECHKLIDSKAMDGGDPNSDAGGNDVFCPYCFEAPSQHRPNHKEERDVWGTSIS